MAKKLKHETRILLLTLLSGTPAVVLSMGLLWRSDFSNSLKWTLTLAVPAVWWGLAHAVRERVIRPLRTAQELGLGELLNGEAARTVQLNFPGSAGRWGIRRNCFRQEGRPHQLLVMTDLSRALRDEERQAWQRIVRVIGHELNNSLAPIKSIAGTMGTMLSKTPRPQDWESDLQNGLAI